MDFDQLSFYWYFFIKTFVWSFNISSPITHIYMISSSLIIECTYFLIFLSLNALIFLVLFYLFYFLNKKLFNFYVFFKV